MSRWIVLLRGVNVGGRNKLLMADFRRALEDAGFRDVETYIQSGNAVLTSSQDRLQVAETVGKTLRSKFHLDVPVLVLDADSLVAAIRNNPFEGDPSRLMFYLCFEPLEDFDTQPLRDLVANGEELDVTSDVIFLHAPEGIGRSKLAEKIDQLVPVQLTARNLRSVQKLSKMAGLR